MRFSLSVGHQTETIMNYCCYYFDDPWKVKALYVIIMSRTHLTSEYALCSSLNIKERLPRNRRDIWSLSEYCTEKYSQRKSIIWPVWQNGWVWLWVWIPFLSHVVLCLNAFVKLQNARGPFCQPVLTGIALLVYKCWPYQPVRSRWCTGHEILWPQGCLLRRKLAWHICK